VCGEFRVFDGGNAVMNGQKAPGGSMVRDLLSFERRRDAPSFVMTKGA